MSDEVTVLEGGKLAVLSNSYELGPTISTHPVDARGFAPMQCYLLREGDESLLIGSGLTVHEKAIIRQLEGVLDGSSLSFMPLALDFMRLSNARPIADRFGFKHVYQPGFANHPSFWLNFRPDCPPDGDGLVDAEVSVIRTEAPIEFGPGGRRKIDFVVPPLRLLPNPWLYDRDTGTMFTVDVFAWLWHPVDRGPWVLTDSDPDDTTVETVVHSLVYNRFWWLAGADTARVRRALELTFEQFEVECIAPDYGCVLKGNDVVRRHCDLLDQALAQLESRDAIGVDVGSWTFGGYR